MLIILIIILVFVTFFVLVWWSYEKVYELKLRYQALSLNNKKNPKNKRALKSKYKFLKNIVGILANMQAKLVSRAWQDKTKKDLAKVKLTVTYSSLEWLVLKEIALLTVFIVTLIIDLNIFFGFSISLAAFFMPDWWLKDKIKHKQNKIMQALPEFLDLLSSATAAGLNFERAVSIILEQNNTGDLYQELSFALQRVKLGQAMSESLQILSQRVNETNFTNFINTLIQAQQLGVSMVESLQNQAEQIRTKHYQLLEKKALEAPIKLLFPLIIFIFPVVFLIIFGPIIIRFIQSM